MRQIVFDFGLDVNAYAALGRSIPHFKPNCCPVCGRSCTLLSQGLRRRGAWTADFDATIFVRRIRCLARGGCRASFTVLPSFVHPGHRHVLAVLAPVLQARFVERRSFEAIARGQDIPAASTQRDLLRAFVASAPGWLSVLCRELGLSHPEMVVDRRVEEGGPHGLVAMAIQCLDWFRSLRGDGPVPKTRWLEELWLWGAVRLAGPLFSPRNRAGPPPQA